MDFQTPSTSWRKTKASIWQHWPYSLAKLQTPLSGWEAKARGSLLGTQLSSLQITSGDRERVQGCLPLTKSCCTSPCASIPEWFLWITSLYLESGEKYVVGCPFPRLVQNCCSYTRQGFEQPGTYVLFSKILWSLAREVRTLAIMNSVPCAFRQASRYKGQNMCLEPDRSEFEDWLNHQRALCSWYCDDPPELSSGMRGISSQWLGVCQLRVFSCQPSPEITPGKPSVNLCSWGGWPISSNGWLSEICKSLAVSAQVRSARKGSTAELPLGLAKAIAESLSQLTSSLSPVLQAFFTFVGVGPENRP